MLIEEILAFRVLNQQSIDKSERNIYDMSSFLGDKIL